MIETSTTSRFDGFMANDKVCCLESVSFCPNWYSGSTIMNSMKLLIPLHFILWKKRLQTMLWHHNVRVNSHQRWKQTAVQHLRSSLVWIDHYNQCNGMRSFMEFMGMEVGVAVFFLCCPLCVEAVILFKEGLLSYVN